MRRKLVAGNWKMNGARSYSELVDALASSGAGCDILVCPPFTLIAAMAGRGVAVGGQTCHAEASGAHTGDVSAEMLREAGATAVIVGHSERRAAYGETDEAVAAKAEAAWRAGLLAVVCIGETEAERDAGDTLAVVARQVRGSVPAGATASNTVLAYEPVWAIGTGRTPSIEEIAEVHRAIRQTLADHAGGDVAARTRILYGGSVKASNARDIFGVEDVDGALVGGASLKHEDFAPIVAAAS